MKQTASRAGPDVEDAPSSQGPAAEQAQARRLEAIGALASGVAHDLNNTLTTILNTYWLIDRCSDDERVRRITAQGTRAADRASHLVRRLLDFAHKENPAEVAVDATRLLEDLAPTLRHAAGPRVAVEVTARPGTRPIITDPRQLETALINLVVNARDAMPHGGALTVTVDNVPADHPNGVGQVAFAVRDTGCGMTAEVLARATESFFTTKGRGAGTGLGLAMVQSFADRAGGALRLDSSPGTGTVATLLLPVAWLSLPDVAAAVQVAEPEVRDRGAILVVDDDDQLRRLLVECLRDLGWTVTAAASGAAALDMAQAEGPLDLVIADVAMPEMDGLTLALRLRAVRPALPVLFMSGDEDAADLLPGEALLHKPFTMSALAHAVAQALGGPIAPTTPGQSVGPDRLAERLRDPRVRAAYEAWLAVGGRTRLPPPDAIDPASFDAADHAALMEVDPRTDPVDFRFVRVGRSLEARFGCSLVGTRLRAHADEALGSLAGAAVRCVRKLQPGYERARFDFGDGAPASLERLLLPLSRNGTGVTHLLSVAVFEPTMETPRDG